MNEGAYSLVTCLPAGDRPLATVMRYPYSVDPSALLRETMPLHLATIVTNWTEVPNQNFSAIDLPGLLFRLATRASESSQGCLTLDTC